MLISSSFAKISASGKEEQTMPGEPRSCFVIMPFSATTACTEGEWSDFFETVLKPSIENAGLDYECHRSSANRGNIVKAIIQSLNDAHVVIADLTDSNPNVFYELGVRHALTNRTILLAQDRDFIPFDLRTYASHVYDWKSEAGREELGERLRALLLEVDESPERADNPVSDFLGGRVQADSKAAESTSERNAIRDVLLGSLAGKGSEQLDIARIAKLHREVGNTVDWRMMIRQTRAHFEEVWPKRIDELSAAEQTGSGIAEDAIYDSCVPTIEEFAIDIAVVEHLALSLADGDDADGVISLFRIMEDWITLSAQPRSGRNLRAAFGSPELLALRILMNCGAKAADNLGFDVMGALLGTPIETRVRSGQSRLAPLPAMRSMFFPEALLGRADLGVLYIARESWKSPLVQHTFASRQQDYLDGLARFLFVTSLVADARFPDSWGKFYPGFKLISGASATIAALIKRLAVTPELVTSFAALTGEDVATFRNRFTERIDALNNAALGGRYFTSLWDFVPNSI
jgi:hypothetical protein